MKKLLTEKRTLEWGNVFLVSVLPVFAILLPFALHLSDLFFLHIPEPGMLNILKNWDGPHYIIVARTWYDLEAITKLLFTSVPSTYYPAHFPLYPAFIALFAPLLGYFYAGLFVNISFGVLLNILFYEIAKGYTKRALFLTAVFTVFPGRFLVTRAILAPETMMVFFMLLSLYCWEKHRYVQSSVWGSLGILTKIKAGFLLPAYIASSLEEMFLKHKNLPAKLLWTALIPLTLLALFTFFKLRTGDFFAFLNAEKGNNLFVAFPFSQFNSASAWIGTAWIEDIVFYFAGMIMLTVTLWKSQENRSWFYFSLFYTAFLIFVPQRDITRFSFPLYPLFLLTFHKFFTSREWKIAFAFLLPAIYLYAINFILQNQAPISNYSPFL